MIHHIYKGRNCTYFCFKIKGYFLYIFHMMSSTPMVDTFYSPFIKKGNTAILSYSLQSKRVFIVLLLYLNSKILHKGLVVKYARQTFKRCKPSKTLKTDIYLNVKIFKMRTKYHWKYNNYLYLYGSNTCLL